MFKRALIAGLLIFFASLSVFSTPLWHCTATSETGMAWNRFSFTHEDARYLPEKMCNQHNPRNKPCEVVCFPPREYWRCLSHDTPAPSEKTGVIGKVGTWYWTSYSKQVAINGARDACRHNSSNGGCYVDPNACAQS